MRTLLFALSFGLYAFSCIAVNNTDDWVLIDQTDTYQNLDSCAQDCIRNVKVWDTRQRTFCRSYGCVCSNSTKGENAVNAESNITSCVTKSCGQPEAVDRARLAFNNLCLVYAINSTQPRQESGK